MDPVPVSPCDHVIAAYARAAFVRVLEEHELFVHTDHVSVTVTDQGALALKYDGPHLSAVGVFHGNLNESTLLLGQVQTNAWQANFGSVDSFRGAMPDGTPLLYVGNTAVTR